MKTLDQSQALKSTLCSPQFKGGLTDDHVLLLPIACISNQVSLPEETVEELNKFKSALRKMYKKQGKVPVFFERNYKQKHLQIQV